MLTVSGEALIENKLKQIEAKLSRGEEVSGFLAHLVTNGNLSRDEIYTNIIDLMVAAMDTV